MTRDISQIHDTILILDFGSQYTHLIARRIREFNVYCELLACTTSMADLKFKPKGIILSGGPYSVYDADGPHVDPSIWDMNVPILGICYGLQEIAWCKGGKVEASLSREYGAATVHLEPSSILFAGLDSFITVWMSHGDKLSAMPPGFKRIAYTDNAPFAGIENSDAQYYGIQFHPEVTHTPQGKHILSNFVINICKSKATWNMTSFVQDEVEKIRSIVGPTAHVIGAVSGGVDSTVAATLMKRAIGDRFHAVLVDNGLMRLNECEQVKQTLQEKLGINLTLVNASSLFLGRLKGVTDPEQKRKIIGNTFIEVFEQEAEKINKVGIEYLLQGTLYPDVIESISFKGPSATIKTHHNVGGLLENMKLKLIEPLRELFKDEVRHLGLLMGIDEALIWRHPFPGPGLAIRILGEITESQLHIARLADQIYMEEIKNAGLYKEISQAYAGLLPVQTVGVMGDQRTYEQVISLRAVSTTDFMTADWYPMPVDLLKRVSSRIINEVKGVNRVMYDISSKPPATIELC